ncbi:MAG: endonuclease/exonuclease/phosphatase family protein [Xanthomonadales bacterium]|jgi:endonuclease/exonuclease/phosphatase family metal-dependent hydrolase|nr:endonuclease/exonuclease/phosphatase family protein [Xanthomonadales bacterium]
MLTLATWNIHRCIGADGEYRPDRIRDVLRSLDADLVALQEVERFRHDPELLDFLCEGSDWTPVSGVTLERESGAYGNALLCRFPRRHLCRHDISVGMQEPRGVIDLVCDAPASAGFRSVRVLATHLGLGMVERRRQLTRLHELVREQPGGPAVDLTVLMGDLNEWLPGSRSLRRLRQAFLPHASPRSFPARRPWFALDRIWVRGDIGSFEVRAIRTPETRLASDHLPLSARVGPALRGASGSGRR